MSAENSILPFLARPMNRGTGTHYLSEQAFYTGQSTRPMQILTGQSVSSLLPDAFNSLLCEAMNFEENGRKATHFVMMHADIVPTKGWLSALIDEQIASGADVISAVVPIKHVESGKTSTGVGKIDGRHSKFRHILQEEAGLLPKTFTIDDVGRNEGDRLLVNTGLMSMSLRNNWIESWMDSGGFRLESHGWSEDGKRKQLCLPEDWLMSWDIQTIYGAKVAATTKVRLLHFGDIGFENRQPEVANVAK